MQPGALDFLKLILPNEGLKCAAIFAGDRKFHRFTSSFEELAQIISSADALGHTVYHACASYKTSESRKQTNVLAVKSFWLDVDAGEGKPYPDQEEAARAVLLFCRAAKLPPPVLVASGSGVHAYWPLSENLAPAHWTDRARALKSLCDQHGLHADGSRTSDSASILRTPGTRNRKGDIEQIVRWGGPVGPYRLSELGALNGAVSILRPKGALLGEPSRLHGSANSPRRSLIAGALSIYGDTPNYAEPIADGCRQVGELRESKGVLSEPQWYAALGVLAHCTDGDHFAHQWSSGYDGYTHEETAARLERARGFGPTTCEKFAGVSVKGCEGCVFSGRITSPIQLGRERKEAIIPGMAAAERTETEQRDGGSVEILSSLPRLPGDFRWHGRSLAFAKESNDGEEVYDVVSTYPLYLKGVQTGEINGETFSLRFGLELPNEAIKELVLGAKTIFSATGISEISGKGAVIHDADLFRRYVREAVDMFNAENRLDKRFEQYGWKDDGSFLYGPNIYIRGEAQPVVGDGEVKLRNQYLGPMKGGELAKWSAAANSLFTKGCEPQSFALLGSFAAPLMRLHSTGEGGSIVSLVNDQSGSGKTTALEAVESVWGRKEAIRLTDDDTRVSKSLILGVLANLPVTWDELYNRDPEKIREFVLMFTNGRDKMRGTQDGAIRHNKASWQTILTLASNNSIVDILQTNAGTDAPSFRVMEFTTEIPKGIARKGDDLKRILRDNSGFAGHAYMQLLTQPQVFAFIREALPKWTDQVWTKSGLNNEHRFWVRTIASVIAASVIVNKLGILEFSTDRITDWAIEYVGGVARGSQGNFSMQPVNVLSQFLSENIGNTLVVPSAWRPRTELRVLVPPKQQLHIRYERDTHRLYVNERFMRAWLVKNNVSITTFLRLLTDMNVLVKENRKITLGAGTDFASGQSTVFEIDGGHPAVRGGVREVAERLDMPQVTRRERVEKYMEQVADARLEK